MKRPLGTLFATLLVLALTVSLAPPETAGSADATIGVRGHWVIEIRDPDGTLVTRREFHNFLEPNNVIGQVLASQRAAGPLAILLRCNSPGCTPPCPPAAPGQSAVCMISEPRLTGAPSAFLFKNLTKTTVAGGFQLRGSAIAANDSTLSSVSTGVNTCAPTVATSGCTAAFFGPLTGTFVTPGIPVVRGQAMQVTVTITFATATSSAAATSTSAPPR